MFELSTKEEWDKLVEDYHESHPGYKQLMRWIGNQDRCFKTMEIAEDEYEKATRGEVL